MIFTARQLQEMHRNGQVVLPYRARLTPLAQDWVRQKRISIGYAEVAAEPQDTEKLSESKPPDKMTAAAGKYLWWCDGPCGPAKAALLAQGRESDMAQLETVGDHRNLAGVVKDLGRQIKEGKAAGGILLVQHGAVVMCMANRCPSLRAVLGTCLEAVEQGLGQIAANVLVIEYPYKSLQQIKNMIGRFVRTKRQLPDELARQLKELSCE